MLLMRKLEAIGTVGVNLLPFSLVDLLGHFAGVPNLGKPLYREKTVYITTHKTAIKLAHGPHRRDVTNILIEVSCFLWKSFHFRRLQKR